MPSATRAAVWSMNSIPPSFCPATYDIGPAISPSTAASHQRLRSQPSETFSVVANSIHMPTIQYGASCGWNMPDGYATQPK